MNSLFAKILVWFWATLAITILVSAVASELTEDIYERPSPFQRTGDFLLSEARNAYEKGGRAGLQEFVERFRRTYRRPILFTDDAGKDLLSGRSFPEMVRKARRGESFRYRWQGRSFIVRPATDGQFWFFWFTQPRPLGVWFRRPQIWWVMLAAVLLCYWLAYHLTQPVRRLQKAVERFGQGDFGARAGSTRGDELGQLARTFDRMAERIETLVAAERRLLLDISHELRSPLARLGVAVELARSGEDREGALNRIEKESDRLNELVGELLQVTRAEGDPASLRAEPVALDRLLAELVEDSEFEAQARGLAVELQPSPPVTVRGDAELLRRAVENVVRNALRYTPPGSRVEVSLEAQAGAARIRIRDYGPGVPDESLPRLFDPFYRVAGDRDRASGGVGLGLSIARRAVELHGGSIAASNAHPGLLVEIRLPGAAVGTPQPTSVS